jgi:hypothetical protein
MASRERHSSFKNAETYGTSRSQTLFGNALRETLFRMSHASVGCFARNRVSQNWFPNRVWEPDPPAFLKLLVSDRSFPSGRLRSRLAKKLEPLRPGQGNSKHRLP